MEERRDLGQFLQSRRALIAPDGVGIERGGRRRVQGLRREELAQLAGISVDYYIRLEQGRSMRPSDEVLTALARALSLNEAERSHLWDLARPHSRSARASRRAERVRPELTRMLQSMDETPALIISCRLDVLAWNQLAAQLMADVSVMKPADRNLARFTFLNPASHDMFPQWESAAKSAVGQLRLAAGRHPEDEALTSLVGELSVNSETFRKLWARGDVQEKSHGRKLFAHPLVGELELHYETFALPDPSGQTMVLYSAQPGTEAEMSLRLLASWAAPVASKDGSTGTTSDIANQLG